MAPERTPEQARQGEKTGHMRYVLLVSTVAAIVILFGLYALWA
jgi:hypothetical protein